MSYKAKLAPLRLSSMNPEDAIAAIVAWANGEVMKEFVTVEKESFVSTAQQKSTIQSVVSSGPSASPVTAAVAVQVAAVVQGLQTITFSPDLFPANWRMLIAEMTLADGTIADLKSEVKNQTVNTFQITCPEAGFLFFSPAPRA